MRASAPALLLLALALAQVPAAAQAAGRASTSIVIRSDGVVLVEVTGAVVPGFNSFDCPVLPLPGTIEVWVDGVQVVPIYYEGKVIVPSNAAGAATIRYVADTVVSDGTVRFEYRLSSEAELKVMQGVVLLTLPPVVRTALEDGVLWMVIRGPANISFIPAGTAAPAPTEAAAPPTTPSPALPGTPAPTTTPPAPPTAPVEAPGRELPGWLAYALAGALALAVLALVLRRRGSSGSAEVTSAGLDDVDRSILSKLAEKGGEALQSELYRELSVPKTTVWRHVRRLESMGYVKVERVGGVNKVKLLRRAED